MDEVKFNRGEKESEKKKWGKNINWGTGISGFDFILASHRKLLSGSWWWWINLSRYDNGLVVRMDVDEFAGSVIFFILCLTTAVACWFNVGMTFSFLFLSTHDLTTNVSVSQFALEREKGRKIASHFYAYFSGILTFFLFFFFFVFAQI